MVLLALVFFCIWTLGFLAQDVSVTIINHYYAVPSLCFGPRVFELLRKLSRGKLQHTDENHGHTAARNISVNIFNAALTTSLNNNRIATSPDWLEGSEPLKSSHESLSDADITITIPISPLLLPSGPTHWTVGEKKKNHWTKESLLLMSNTEDCCLCKVIRFSWYCWNAYIFLNSTQL